MPTSNKAKGDYAAVNGLRMYHEIHGSGQPLVLLHGGFGVIDMFGQVLSALAQTRQVIGVELQGHGNTADIDRPLTFAQLADDVAALIEHLGLEQADMFGFSLGGGVALQTAIRHPEVVRKLALASTPYKRDGWYPENLAAMGAISVETFAGTPIHEAYLKTSPRPDAWPTVVAKMRQLLAEDYDWAEGVATLKTPIRSTACPARGAPGHHACWLGSAISWDHDSHRAAPPDHHRIPRHAHAGRPLTPLTWDSQNDQTRSAERTAR
jgi:pimeloyl-ACP methyl ester carboxylesterase